MRYVVGTAVRDALAALAVSLAIADGARGGDVAFGEYLSSECVTCHQVSGKATEGVPSIVAWPEDQFIAVMHSYRAKERDNVVMQTIAARLADDEIAALAAYFARLPVPKHP